MDSYILDIKLLASKANILELEKILFSLLHRRNIVIGKSKPPPLDLIANDKRYLDILNSLSFTNTTFEIFDLFDKFIELTKIIDQENYVNTTFINDQTLAALPNRKYNTITS